MSDDTCYTENYRSSCEDVGSGDDLGYMKTDSDEIVEIEPNVQQYECDKFWTTLDGSTPNSSASFLSEKYPISDFSNYYYNNDGDESNRKLAMKCMPRGGGGDDLGCMSPLNYFDEIPNLPEDPQERIQTWEQLFTSMREQFLDPNICQRTESIYTTPESEPAVEEPEPQAAVDEPEPQAAVDEPEPQAAVEEPEPQAAVDEPDAEPADDTTSAATTVNVESDDVNTCHIGHILDQAVTNVNSRITDTSKQISHTCSSEVTLNSGESCYLYCNSLKDNGNVPSTDILDNNPNKSSKISCGTVQMGQNVNCGPDESRTLGDMCPHSHHIYLKCSEDSEEIDIDFKIDTQTATGVTLLGTALAAAGYLIFL